MYNPSLRRLVFKAIPRAFRRLWAYYRDTESTAGPLGVAWELTYSCDCDCAFCATHELQASNGGLTREGVLKVAAALGRSGVSVVTLSGGEPLLSPHLEAVLRIFQDYGVVVSIATSGGQLAKKARLLGETGVHSVSISLDSLSASLHDERRRRKGLTGRIRKGIVALRNDFKAGKILIRLRFVVTPANFREMVDFAAYWRGKVDEVSFQPVQDLGLGNIHHVSDRSGLFTQDLRSSFEDEIRCLTGHFPEYRIPYYQRMPEFLFELDQIKNSFFCIIPALGFKVTPSGDAVPCSDANAILGNLARDRFEDIWNHPVMIKLRSRSRHKCRECLCWTQPLSINDRIPCWAPNLLRPVSHTARI